MKVEPLRGRKAQAYGPFYSGEWQGPKFADHYDEA